MSMSGLRCLLPAVTFLLFWGCSQRGTPQAPAPSRRSEESTLADRTPLLTRTAHLARQAGAEQFAVIAQGIAGAGDEVAGFIALDENDCVVVFARGGAGVIDVDLHAYGDDGTQYGSDQAPDARPKLFFCVPNSTRIFVSARVAQGSGLVAVGAVLTDAVSGARVAEATGAPSQNPSLDEPATAWPQLEQILANRRARLGGQWVDQRKVAVPVDARVPTRLSAVVSIGSCLDILVLPAEPAMVLELQIASDEGRILERRLGRADELATTFCSQNRNQQLHLTLRPPSGQGVALVALSRSAERPIGSSTPPTEIGGLGQLPADAELLAKEVSLVRGRVTFQKVTGKGCTEYLMAGAAPWGGALRAWTPDGQPLADVAPGTPNRSWVCHRGDFRLDVEAEWTGTAQLYGRRLSESSPGLLEHPHLASRLLNEAARRWGDLKRGPVSLDVHQLHASVPKSVSWANPSSDACQLIVVASATPTSLRLVKSNATWGESASAAEGARAVSLEVCGTQSPLIIDITAERSTTALVGLFFSP